jgi:hypothetical protein
MVEDERRVKETLHPKLLSWSKKILARYGGILRTTKRKRSISKKKIAVIKIKVKIKEARRDRLYRGAGKNVKSNNSIYN